VAAHCQVLGEMLRRTSPVDGKSYAIGFEMRLPLNWNGRFFYQANGGVDGSVVTATGPVGGGGPLDNALNQGFAVISSDAGHGAPTPFFGIDPQARLDYGYQAVGKLTPMAKAVIKAAYGKAPDRSYIGGCSNGGRHTMVAAARYADQYDGFLVGDPGFRLPLAAIANIAGAKTYASLASTPGDLGTGFTQAERALVSNAVLAKCDALDGAADGLVQDTKACQAAFDLNRDVPTCAGARRQLPERGPEDRHRGAVRRRQDRDRRHDLHQLPIRRGAGNGRLGELEVQRADRPRFRRGRPDLAGAAGRSGQLRRPSFALNGSLARHAGQGQRHRRCLHGDRDVVHDAAESVQPGQPEEPRREDAGLPRHQRPDLLERRHHRWYEALRAANGGDASNFARFFRVPGMNHCSGGPATDQFDMLTPLVNWVEKGQAPASVAARAAAGMPAA
jgi:hypothetical protein